MAQRINVTTAARLTRRSEKTWRAWLAEDPCPISVIHGPAKGSRDGKKGHTRWLDIEEVRALHVKRGGTAWDEKALPEADTDALRAEVLAMDARLGALEKRLREVLDMTLLPALPISPAPTPHPTSPPPALVPVRPVDPVMRAPALSRLDPVRPVGPVTLPRQPNPTRPLATEKRHRVGSPDDLPPGWVLIVDVCEQHQMSAMTVRSAYLDGRLSVTKLGEKVKREEDGSGGQASYVLTPENKPRFHRLWAKRFGNPCQFCGWRDEGHPEFRATK